jgi:adenine specific DNA methylase Mod
LLEEFSGSIDLIYIDPPFDTGADFSFRIPLGDDEDKITKEQSVLEMIAYRDMWGRGSASYLSLMYERLVAMRRLLSERGSIYVHCDFHVVTNYAFYSMKYLGLTICAETLYLRDAMAIAMLKPSATCMI